MYSERALVLAPHPDDGVMGCGGTLARLIEQGTEVHYATFSLCAESVPNGFSPDVLKSETECAMRRLGVSYLFMDNCPVRHFPGHRQAILERLVQIKRDIAPDLVFIPSSHDVHQDHQVIYWEGMRAFQNINTLSYELPWKNQVFRACLFVDLLARHLEKKIEALHCYQSQKHKHYTDDGLFVSLARLRGKQVGIHLAEAFQVVRWIL